jgi:hypothetical protein
MMMTVVYCMLWTIIIKYFLYFSILFTIIVSDAAVSKTESNKRLQFGEANPVLPLVYSALHSHEIVMSPTVQSQRQTHLPPLLLWLRRPAPTQCGHRCSALTSRHSDLDAAAALACSSAPPAPPDTALLRPPRPSLAPPGSTRPPRGGPRRRRRRSSLLPALPEVREVRRGAPPEVSRGLARPPPRRAPQRCCSPSAHLPPPAPVHGPWQWSTSSSPARPPPPPPPLPHAAGLLLPCGQHSPPKQKCIPLCLPCWRPFLLCTVVNGRQKCICLPLLDSV